MTIIKVALADVEFFNNEKHPAVARVDNLGATHEFVKIVIQVRYEPHQNFIGSLGEGHEIFSRDR
jgi:hypothetical protein